MKKSFFVWLISFAATGVFIICLLYGYFAAKDGIQKYIDVKNNKSDVPYSGQQPENFGIKLTLPDEKGIVFSLDFEQQEIRVFETGSEESNQEQKYFVDISYDLFCETIDKIGGIIINQNGEEVRITGITAAETLKESAENSKEILPAFINAICKNGLSKTDFLYVLENCEKTNLSVVDLFPYNDMLSEMLKNIKADT